MTPGSRYLVRFRAGGQRVDRDMIAVYLGWSRTAGKHQFSLRPYGGTTSLTPEEFISSTPTTEGVRLPRKAPNDAPAAA